MIQEKLRTVPDDIIKTAFPTSIRERVKRDSLAAEFINSNTVATLASTTDIYTLEDLIDFVVPNNFVVSQGLINFHRFLMRSCDCKALFSKRKLTSGGYSIFILDDTGSYFSFRKGNTWGSLFFIDSGLGLLALQTKLDDMLSTIRKTGWALDRLMPPARMAENLIRQNTNLSSLPNFALGDIDNKTINYSFTAFKGGRMESAQLGSFKNVYDYDYNSSHFAILKGLPAIRPGFVTYKRSAAYIKEALLGYGLIYIKTPKSCPIGLLANRLEMSDKEARLYYTVGESVTYRTKSEIDFILGTGYAKVKILDFIWVLPIRPITYPFLSVLPMVEKLLVDPITHDYIKLVASTSWGKFISRKGGPLWNPLYAAEIAAQARIKVTELALKNINSMVAITVDGLAMTEPLPATPLSTEIGGVKVREYPSMVSLSDYYRLTPRSVDSWEVVDNGVHLKDTKATIPYVLNMGGNADDVGKPIEGITIPFGSTKRKSPKKLNKALLTTNTYRLKPPTDSEAVELYFNTNNKIPLDF